MQYLLLPREKRVISIHEAEYRNRFGSEPADDPNLCMALGDNSGWGSWSAVSEKIPTFRTSGGLLWFPYFRRWMLPHEKLAVQGVPVEPKFAAEMGVTPLPVRDHQRSASILGNSMNMQIVGMIQGIALACIGRAP